MAIDCLVSGHLVKQPEKKTSVKGKEYVVLVIRQPDESFIRISAFNELDELVRLSKGDAIAAVGSLTVGTWERGGEVLPSVSVMASRVISPSIKRPKPTATKTEKSPYLISEKAIAGMKAAGDIARAGDVNSLEDDIPWQK